MKDKLDKVSPSHRHGSDFSEIMDAAKGAIGKAHRTPRRVGPGPWWWDWDAGNGGELKNGAQALIQLGVS